MNPLYAAAAAGAFVATRRKCPACKARLRIVRQPKDGRYHCKKCGHPFTAQELSSPRSST